MILQNACVNTRSEKDSLTLPANPNSASITRTAGQTIFGNPRLKNQPEGARGRTKSHPQFLLLPPKQITWIYRLCGGDKIINQAYDVT
jgi:hypothetical protein